MAFYSDIESIRAAFFDHETPDWELFDGKPTKRPTGATRGRYLLAESKPGTGIEDSWADLANWLDRISLKGGNATVLMGPKELVPVARIPISLSRKTMTNPTDGPGIGAGNNAYYSVEHRVSEARKMWELEKQVEELQDAGVGSIWDRLAERLVEGELLDKVVTSLIAIAGQKAAVGMPVQQPTQQAENRTDTNEYDDDDMAVVEFIGTIQQQLGSEEKAFEFIRKLNEAVKKNPALLQMIN